MNNNLANKIQSKVVQRDHVGSISGGTERRTTTRHCRAPRVRSASQQRCLICVQPDNVTTVAYINHFSGPNPKSEQLSFGQTQAATAWTGGMVSPSRFVQSVMPNVGVHWMWLSYDPNTKNTSCIQNQKSAML